MPENEAQENETKSQELEDQEGTEEVAEDEGTETEDSESEGEAPKGGENKDRDDAPEWALKEIRALRAENAAKRTKAKELQGQLDAAPKVEALKELQDKNLDLLRENVAITAGIFGTALANALTATTREELEKQAQELAPFAPGRPRVLRGGLSGSGDEGDDDVQAALKHARASSGRI